ncbi:hypothetical protein ACIBJI_39955 [Nocardia sp. NPDC050408]|uniref:hypothetical protein n=1 Tax=Nocardia sp. NPDC050408 TaxID=3364319 RepID=UPI0037A264C6
MNAHRDAARGQPDETPQPGQQLKVFEVLDVLALAAVLTTVVALVVVGAASTGVIAAAGAFVVAVMRIWLRLRSA